MAADANDVCDEKNTKLAILRSLEDKSSLFKTFSEYALESAELGEYLFLNISKQKQSTIAKNSEIHKIINELNNTKLAAILLAKAAINTTDDELKSLFKNINPYTVTEGAAICYEPPLVLISNLIDKRSNNTYYGNIKPHEILEKIKPFNNNLNMLLATSIIPLPNEITEAIKLHFYNNEIKPMIFMPYLADEARYNSQYLATIIKHLTRTFQPDYKVLDYAMASVDNKLIKASVIATVSLSIIHYKSNQDYQHDFSMEQNKELKARMYACLKRLKRQGVIESFIPYWQRKVIVEAIAADTSGFKTNTLITNIKANIETVKNDKTKLEKIMHGHFLKQKNKKAFENQYEILPTAKDATTFFLGNEDIYDEPKLSEGLEKKNLIQDRLLLLFQRMQAVEELPICNIPDKMKEAIIEVIEEDNSGLKSNILRENINARLNKPAD